MAFGDTITEAVLGKVSVPEDTDNTPNAVAEGAAVNTTVGITAHSTFANGNAGLDYTLSADSSGGGFKIDHNTGVVTVADPSKIDFESAPGHVYTITVLATKNNNFSSSQTFTISVNDVAPSTPVDSNAAANTVLEGAANGTTVGVTASSTDVNGGAVTYSLIGDTSGGGFTVNAATGVVTVADGSKIDFESSAGHAYTVTVQSSDGTLTSSQAFTINVGDVALTTPVDTNGAGNSVAEGAAAGTTVGITASATDPSGPATTYSLIGDTSGGGFTINASTGVVTVANPAKLDFESSAPGHTYNITVQASNGTTTTSQVFTVGVTDVAPSAPTDSNTAAADTVVEGAANGTAVGITASSTDVNGGAVTYSLTGDTSGGGFTINATTGVITVADSTKINFETAPGHAYTVTAQSSDGTLANSHTFTIAVTDVAPTAPVDSDGATNTVAEGAANGSTVGITAFSTDVNGPGVTYSLVGDTSGGGFTINSTTGVITVADGTKLDYETHPSHAYTVTAQASDGTLSNQQTFTIALTDVAPTAPTDIDGAINTIAEGAANGSTVGITASSVDPNGPATTYSLTDNAGGRFAINSSTGIVTVANGAAIDFETAPGHAYGITVQATNGALTTSSAFSIGVTDVGPSTPTDSNVAPDSVFEGAANGTVVGITASSTDPGGGPAPTYSLTDDAGGRFTINSTTGVVTVANGAAIDFETAPGPGHSYGITVQSTAGALSTTHTFSIGVGDVNEAPAGTDKTVVMLEGDSYTFSVADFGFSDPSDSVNPNSLLAVKMTTVPGAGTGTFTNNGVTVNAGDSVSATDIAAGHLVFTPTAHSNGAPEASFTFQVQDNGGTANNGVDLDQSANTVTINVNAVNDAPINSVPGAQSVNEEATLTFSTGNGNAITISDVDVGSGNETVTLTVTNGTLALGSHAGLVSFSPDNAASITLTGTIANIDNALNGLTYTGNLNFNGTETLTVSTNDNGNTGAGGPKIDSDPITINVAAVNDAPVNTVPGAQTVNEDTALVFNGAKTISISDVDANGGNETVTLSVASGTLTLSGTTGLVFGTGDGTADSTMTFTGTVSDINTALNGLIYQGNLNFNGPDTLNITTNDNGNTGSGGPLSTAGHVDISVSAVNDAPVVTAGHTLSYTENQAATAFDPAITVSDVDSPNLASATVQITGGYVNGEDVLAFSNTASITGTFDPSTGKLTLTGSDTAAHYQAALASVTYVNTSDNPSGAARTVTIVANDGALDSIAATDTINVTPVNDAPVVTAGHTLSYTENQAATAIDPAIAVSDVDSANLVSATMQITGNYVSGEDVLAFANTATITGSFDAGTGKLTLTGSDTVAHYQAALASVTYVNTSDNPSGLARTVTVVTNDGALNSVAATDTINVTPVNDAPVATAGHTLAYTENQAATAIDPLIAVTDVDSANLVSATVQITGNYANSQDVLSFTDQNGIAGSFNAATGTMTLTGSSSVANYQAALDSVKYFNTSDDPSGAARTVTIITNDGAANSVAVTGTITVTPVNDAPTLTATGNNPNYSNGVDLFSGVTATPVENGQLLDQLKLTVTNISGTATDSLTIDGVSVALTNGNVVSTSTPGVTATVAVSGSTATVTVDSTPGLSDAAMSALIDGLSYTDTNVNPGDPARVVTITQLHDTGGTSPGVDTAVLNVASTVFFDQAPVVTAGHTLSYTENQAATAFDTAITVTDADNANLASATVQITGGYVNGEDVLAFANTASITGTFDSSTGKLTLSGSDTVAHYQAALASITYVNTSENPSGAPRTVTIVANDGSVDSTPVTDTINVTPVNDAPVVIASHTLSYTENQGAAVLDAAVAVFDVDSANLASATVQITNNYVNGEDVLAFANTATITGSFDPSTGKLTLTGSDTVANYQAALRTITYTDTSENPSGLARTVTIIANDGTADSVAKTDTINVTPVNDAPVTTAGGTLSYTENQAATVIDSGVTVTDVDNANMASATVSIGTGFATGQDVLDANVTGTTIGKSYNATTGVLTLNGSDTKAHYQQVLDSVTYFNSSENPSGAARTINYTVNDGAANSNTSTATVNVTPVNDAPVVTIGATTAFSEPANGTPAANSVPVTIAPSLTVSDVDSANLTQATFVLNNLKPSDALSVSGHAGASGDIGSIHFAITSTATTETVTLTGTDTVAHYNAVLDLVQFNNTSENPDTTARSYTVTAVDDGTGTNTGSASTTETVTAVNDAPVNTVPVEQDTIFSRTATSITGLSVSDVDSGAGETTVLSVAHGTLNVLTVGGGAAVTNNGTATVTLTGTAEQIATTLAATNGVVYTSGAFTGTDVLTVTTNDNGATGTGLHPSVVSTENLGIIPKVWFIDNSASSVGADGSQGHPFNSIAAFNAVNDGGAGHPQTNDYIYLKTGTGTYSETDGIHLLNGQQLVGAGDGLTFPDPLHAGTLTIETAGTRPVIDVQGGAGNDAIHLAQDNTIHGFNVATENAAATGIVDNGGTVGTLNISNMDVGVDPDGAGALHGNLGQAISITHGGTGGSMTFGTVSSGGGTTGISLGGALVTSFSATGGTLSGHSTSEVAISGGSGTVSYGGTIGDGSGLSASVSGRTAGTVTLSGNINDGNDTGGGITVSGNTGGTIDFTGATKTLNTGTGNAVSLSTNTGATIDFTGGGLDIDTTTGTGFSASTGTVTVTGLGNTINTTSGTALSLANLAVGSNGVTFDSATATSAATGISIDTVTGGAINVNGGSITGATTNGVIINAAQNNISIASSVTSTSAGHSVQVTGSGSSAAGGNTITFSGAVTDPGLGVNLDNNDQHTNGATVNFTGALNIDATTNTGFNATNGGTVNASNAANSITTTTGTALNVNGTNIGSSNLVFHDISSSGGSNNGINLVSTGTAAGNGGLHITGTGTTAGSGGTIASKTGADGSTTQGDGIFLSNTKDVQLSNMNLHDFQNFGIQGTSVNGFSLTGSTVNATASGSATNGTVQGNPNNEGSISFNELTGTANITNSTVADGLTSDLSVLNTVSGSALTLNISGSTFTGQGTTTTQELLLVAGQNAGDTPSITTNITTSHFTNNSARDIQAVANGAASMVVNIGQNGVANSGGTFGGMPAAMLDLDHNSTGDFAFNVQNAAFTVGGPTFASVPINVFNGTGSGSASTFQGRILNNSITGGNNSGFDGISMVGSGPGTMTMLVDGNTITNVAGVGIDYTGAQNSATNHTNLTITNNTITMPDPNASFGVQVSAQASSSASSVVEATITGNNVINDTASPDYRVDARFATAFLEMPGYTGAATDLAAVRAFVSGNNKTNGATSATTEVSASAGIGSVGHFSNTPGGAATPLPSNPQPLFAADGGVASASGSVGEMHLSQAELDSVVAAAIGQWAAAGASAAQLAALHSTVFTVADLAGVTVGEQTPGHITIDVDAAGHGWFVDPTPNDNSEFTHAQNAAGTDLLTDPSTDAAGHLDLLTTVTHELGHVLGLDDVQAPADDLMYVNLVDGERRLPDATDVAQANDTTVAQAVEAAMPLTAQAAAGTPIVVGTPSNDTINAGHGGNILFGGAGADNFVFGSDTPLNAPTPAQITHVADYSAAQGDTFDFSAITSAFHNSGVSDALVVRAVEDVSGKFATLQVDHIDPMGLPSAPNWVNVAQLDGAHSGDAVNVLIDSHSSVHLAQIHVDLLV